MSDMAEKEYTYKLICAFTHLKHDCYKIACCLKVSKKDYLTNSLGIIKPKSSKNMGLHFTPLKKITPDRLWG
jgi:hypothetical protein